MSPRGRSPRVPPARYGCRTHDEVLVLDTGAPAIAGPPVTTKPRRDERDCCSPCQGRPEEPLWVILRSSPAPAGTRRCSWCLLVPGRGGVPAVSGTAASRAVPGRATAPESSAGRGLSAARNDHFRRPRADVAGHPRVVDRETRRVAFGRRGVFSTLDPERAVSGAGGPPPASSVPGRRARAEAVGRPTCPERVGRRDVRTRGIRPGGVLRDFRTSGVLGAVRVVGRLRGLRERLGQAGPTAGAGGGRPLGRRHGRRGVGRGCRLVGRGCRRRGVGRGPWIRGRHRGRARRCPPGGSGTGLGAGVGAGGGRRGSGSSGRDRASGRGAAGPSAPPGGPCPGRRRPRTCLPSCRR